MATAAAFGAACDSLERLEQDDPLRPKMQSLLDLVAPQLQKS